MPPTYPSKTPTSLRRAVKVALQASLLAAPVLLGAAPSQAATFTKTFTGFTEAFAAGNWQKADGGAGQTTITPTTITFTMPGTTAAQAGAFFNTAVLNYSVPGADAFLGGTYSYKWTWTFTPVTNGTSFPFGPVTGLGTIQNLATWTFGSDVFNVANYNTAGTGTGVPAAANNTFGFKLLSNNPDPQQTGTVTATIYDWVFTGTFQEAVPGPLPLAGAAAGFAWSRKLRRRLKTSQVSA